MTKIEQMIETIKFTAEQGHDCITFMVGKNTGYHPSIVNALRSRGYTVVRVPPSAVTYRVYTA